MLLRDRLDSFVDVYSPEDVYPTSLWSAMGRYFAGPEGAALKLAGGRYSCAQDLVARRLPFLAGLSLGGLLSHGQKGGDSDLRASGHDRSRG